MGDTFNLSEIVDDIIDNHIALKLRNGDKAYITYNNVRDENPLKGIRIDDRGAPWFESWSSSGSWSKPGQEHDCILDIVGLWEGE